MDTKLVITQVINTLNLIEVKGAGNLSHLLGCIEMLQRVLRDMTDKEAILREMTNKEATDDATD